MPLLFSNFPPLQTSRKTYQDVFEDLIKQCDVLHIASGYISNDSLVDLKTLVEANAGPRIELCVGMHYFEGLTQAQKIAVESLDNLLKGSSLGGVYFVVNYPFHGKLASFSAGQDVIGALVGSSNLSNIASGQRQYEADYLLENGDALEAKGFLQDLMGRASAPYADLEGIQTIKPRNNLLEGQYGVESADSAEIASVKSGLSSGPSFEIPLKTEGATKSNLNAFFGKGRENQQGFVLPRSWYEVELIVPKTITSQPGYPKADKEGGESVFNVITDDGWKFKCKVSGDYSKNLRSEDDLKIMGKWIKGRLENTGILKPGELVTSETLGLYGRNSLTLTKVEGSDYWYLDFGAGE